MRIEEDTKAQEAIHSADEGTEPGFIPPKRTRAPMGPNRPRVQPFAPNLTQLQLFVSNRIQLYPSELKYLVCRLIAPNRMQLHLPTDAISLQTMYLSSGQCSLSQ